jgi:anti-sigma B factor antagonist
MLRNLRKIFGSGDAAPVAPSAPFPHDPSAAGGPGQVFSQHLVTCSMLGQTLVVTVVEPELNSFKAADVNHEIRRLMSEHPQARNLVIDMGNIEYLDSAGLNAFVDLLTVVQNTGGKIGVAAATQQVEVLFKLTRLELVFTIRRTVIDAIDAIEKAG